VNIRVKNEQQIEKYLSDGIIDCWKMMGEGKVSIFSQWVAETYSLGSVYPTCVICARIAFNETSLNKARVNLSDVDPVRYMLSHKIPNSDQSYFEYFAGKDGKLKAPPSLNLIKSNILEPLATGMEKAAKQAGEEKNTKLEQDYEKSAETLRITTRNMELLESGEIIVNDIKNVKVNVDAGERWNIIEKGINTGLYLWDGPAAGGLPSTDGEVWIFNSRERVGQVVIGTGAISITGNIDAALKTELESFTLDFATMQFKKSIATLPPDETNEYAIMFMQVSAPDQIGSLGNIAATMGAASFVIARIPIIGSLAKKLVVAAIDNPVGALITGGILLAAVGAQQAWTSHLRSVAASYCADISVGSETRNGCSTVRLVKYDPEEIRAVCTDLASIP
jgi:hypothetical protein